MEPSSAPWRVIETPEPAAPSAPQPVQRGLPWPAVGLALGAVVVAVAAILVTAQGEPVIGVDGAAGLGAGSADRGGPGPSDPASQAPVLVVDVGGAVRRPGVYELPAGSRVGDAIQAAGGYGATVDAGRVDQLLNLAAPVRDGEKIRVPVRGEPALGGGAEPAGGTGAGGEAPGGGLVDLNTASAEELDTLPGVGPATAAKIIASREERPFAAVGDLLARKVVGAATLEKLQPLVTVGP